MSTNTTNYNLIKPDLDDFYDVGQFNQNADIIDGALSGKVNAESGKGLSTNDYTDAEKAKLASVDGNYFKGVYPTLTDLQIAHPTANEGDYAYVGTTGTAEVNYIWDDTDSAWEAGGQGTAETPASVKTKYESNANTNAYTDTEKAKLAGLANYDDTAVIGLITTAQTTANTANATANAATDDMTAHKIDYVRQPAYAATAGSLTAYTVTITPTPSAVTTAGFGITIVPHVDCGASPTLKINTFTAAGLRKDASTPFAAGELKAGVPYTFRRVGSYFLASSGAGGGDPSTIAGLFSPGMLESYGGLWFQTALTDCMPTNSTITATPSVALPVTLARITTGSAWNTWTIAMTANKRFASRYTIQLYDESTTFTISDGTNTLSFDSKKYGGAGTYTFDFAGASGTVTISNTTPITRGYLASNPTTNGGSVTIQSVTHIAVGTYNNITVASSGAVTTGTSATVYGVQVNNANNPSPYILTQGLTIGIPVTFNGNHTTIIDSGNMAINNIVTTKSITLDTSKQMLPDFIPLTSKNALTGGLGGNGGLSNWTENYSNRVFPGIGGTGGAGYGYTKIINPSANIGTGGGQGGCSLGTSTYYTQSMRQGDTGGSNTPALSLITYSPNNNYSYALSPKTSPYASIYTNYCMSGGGGSFQWAGVQGYGYWIDPVGLVGVGNQGSGAICFIAKGNVTISSTGGIDTSGARGGVGHFFPCRSTETSSAGGAGLLAGGNGGGGSGGSAVGIFYYGSYTNSGTITSAGGDAGAGGRAFNVGTGTIIPSFTNGNAGTAGSAGAIVTAKLTL